MFSLNEGQTEGFGVPGRESDRDGKTREVFLSDGVTVKLEAKDPYGFWFISWSNGRTPEELKHASFTSASEALRHLTIYVTKNKYKTEVSTETPFEKPVLKTKTNKVA